MKNSVVVKRLLFFIAGLVILSSCSKQTKDSFVTTWDTRNEGYGDSTQIVIPLHGTYTLEWQEIGNEKNRGSREDCVNNTVLQFPSPGKYQVVAYGHLETMSFALYTIDTIPEFGKAEYKLISVDQWGKTAWTSFDSFFYNCYSLSILATDTPDLSNVTSFRQAFCNARNFNSPIGHWNMSNARDISYMFYDAWKFDQPINTWNVGNVETTHSMFGYAKAFNQPLDKWNVSHVDKMSGMFNHAYAFNQNIEGWDVSHVTTMAGMFDGASSFNQPLEKWNVSQVDNMILMFMNADNFNQPLDKWDVSGIKESGFEGMFYLAEAFNQPLNSWDVSEATDMNSVFVGAKSFNQPLNHWKVAPVCKLAIMLTSDEPRGIFSGTAMSEKNLATTLKAWNRPELIKMFK